MTAMFPETNLHTPVAVILELLSFYALGGRLNAKILRKRLNVSRAQQSRIFNCSRAGDSRIILTDEFIDPQLKYQRIITKIRTRRGTLFPGAHQQNRRRSLLAAGVPLCSKHCR